MSPGPASPPERTIDQDSPLEERESADCIRAWLLSDEPQIRAGAHDGGVLGWTGAQARELFVYPEIVGYYLTVLSYCACEEPALGQACAERAERALGWLERRQGAWLTRDHLKSTPESDWRNGAVFTFDLGMLLKGVSHWTDHEALAARAHRLQAIIVAELQTVTSSRGLLGSHRAREGAELSPLPIRWSTMPGPHHVKVASVLTGLDEVDERLRQLAGATTAHWTEVVKADLGHVGLHPTLYFLEGLLLHHLTSRDENILDLVGALLLRILESQRPGGDMGERVGRWGGRSRGDVTAQALRLCAILLSLGDPSRASQFRAHGRSLRRALTDRFAAREGALTNYPRERRDEAENPPNVWATIFAYQALSMYAIASQDGDIPRALLRRLA
jgi:hypothetical protein